MLIVAFLKLVYVYLEIICKNQIITDYKLLGPTLILRTTYNML